MLTSLKMAGGGIGKRAVTLQCGVYRETTIFEDGEFSVFLELVYFFLDCKVSFVTGNGKGAVNAIVIK